MESFPFHDMLPELQGEVRAKLAWREIIFLSATCTRERVHCKSFQRKWPDVIRKEYQDKTVAIAIHRQDEDDDMVQYLSKRRDLLMGAVAELWPWFAICAPTGCNDFPHVGAVWPESTSVSGINWSSRPPRWTTLDLTFGEIDGRLWYKIHILQVEGLRGLDTTHLWGKLHSPLPVNDVACLEMLKRIAINTDSQ